MSHEARQLRIGTRVTVYWPDDDQWYKGTVVLESDDDHVLIDYDNGTTNSLDCTTDRWRSSSKPDTFLKLGTGQSEKQRDQVARLETGSRISVWWPQKKAFFTGTLTQIENPVGDGSDNNSPHHVRYDDGDGEWMDLLHRNFKRVDAKAERLHVGSRVSVYKKEDKRQYFCATVTKIRLRKAQPHRIRYDDRSRGKEWINLNASPFLDIEPCTPTAANPTAKVNASNLKKRKREFLKPPPVDINRARKKTKAIEEAATPIRQCTETCGVCKSRAKRPRATSCHHIFCKRCIKDHFQRDGACPLCKVAVTAELVKYDPGHVSFKAVQALDRATAEVVMTFSSASAASLESCGRVPNILVTACQSKGRDDRECNGFYWRFQGSKARILRAGEAVNAGIPIEQVDLGTGEVVETFASSRKAFEKTKVSRCSIKRVLERRGKASAGGYFWRFQGETHTPWRDPARANLNPVEQLDFETGDFLKSYVSIAEAKRAMGVRPNAGCIGDVCDGRGRATAYGYFWRWKGSQQLPNHMTGVQKIVQILRSENGEVIKEFRTSREAQAYLGHQCCWSTVCRYCREKGFFRGYYWQYRLLREPKRAEEVMVGKRLRVQQLGNIEWLEGKIDAFYYETGEHTILYDNGSVERRKLEDTQYEWKNDQGQKPVEQLGLKTGDVLATFDSISDAATSVGCRAGNITGVCTGQYRSSSGFFWRYKGSDALPPKPKQKRQVEQLCLESGQVLATFDSISAAAKFIGITSPGISYCCNGRNGSKSAGGFGWRFVTEPNA